MDILTGIQPLPLTTSKMTTPPQRFFKVALEQEIKYIGFD